MPPKKQAKNALMDYLWYALGSLLTLSVVSRFILFVMGRVNTTIGLIDLVLNILITIALFSKSFIGIVLLTFAVLLGLFTGAKSLVVVFQIILLLMTLPLWIKQFSKS